MYQVIYWSDVQGDFVELRDRETNRIRYMTEAEAVDEATRFLNRGVQARVEYIRNRFIEKPKRKRPRAGRIKRIQTTEFFGDRVRIVGVVQGSKVVK